MTTSVSNPLYIPHTAGVKRMKCEICHEEKELLARHQYCKECFSTWLQAKRPQPEPSSISLEIASWEKLMQLYPETGLPTTFVSYVAQSSSPRWRIKAVVDISGLPHAAQHIIRQLIRTGLLSSAARPSAMELVGSGQSTGRIDSQHSSYER